MIWNTVTMNANGNVYNLSCKNMIADVTPTKLYAMMHESGVTDYDNRSIEFGITTITPATLDDMITDMEADAVGVGFSTLTVNGWALDVAYLGAREIEHETNGVIRVAVSFFTMRKRWAKIDSYTSPASTKNYAATAPSLFDVSVTVEAYSTLTIVIRNMKTSTGQIVFALRGQNTWGGQLVFAASHQTITIAGVDLMPYLSEADFTFKTFPKLIGNNANYRVIVTPGTGQTATVDQVVHNRLRGMPTWTTL